MEELELLLPVLEQYKPLGAQINGSLKERYVTLSLPESDDNSMPKKCALEILRNVEFAAKQLPNIVCYRNDCYCMLIYAL